jgi:hypothetical protein
VSRHCGAGGLDVPTSGEVLLDGERVDSLSEAKRAVLRRQEVGYVFQFFNLIGNLSVADNVELPMLLVGSESTWTVGWVTVVEVIAARPVGGTVCARIGAGDRGDCGSGAVASTHVRRHHAR